MKKIFFAFSLLVCLFASCGGDDDLSDNSKSDSPSAQIVESIDSDYTYELPVIFHVLYHDASKQDQYIPYQRLANILDYVNNIYAGGIYGESENVHVKFVLATKDENGKTLRYPGVEYVRYTGDYPIDPNEFMDDNTGNNVKYIWDPNRYINVMMYNFKQTNENELTLGISHMPYSFKGSHELSGLSVIDPVAMKLKSNYLTKNNLKYAYCSSINSLFANQASDGGYYQSSRYTNPHASVTSYYAADIVVTLAHELGHYLGLYHAFTEARGDSDNDSVNPVDSCADTDYCTDTYSYNRNEYIEYESYLYSQLTQPTLDQLLLRSNCDGTQYYSANIMDYSWTLGYKISKQQKERIRNVLYYSPLIPGPKMSTGSTRASEGKGSDEPLNLKITTIK